MPRKLIGIFGGAFDPVHNGHSAITKYCIEKLCMEKIIVHIMVDPALQAAVLKELENV